jgi:flagella basal body P-ring formation protein FlgA
VPDVSADDDSLMAAHSYIAVGVSRLSAAYSTGPFLVQPGAPAWLVIEDSGMKIMEKVMPLRKGHAGETVRVRDVTAHRVLVGQVIGEKLLRPVIGGAETSPERTR